MKRIVVYATVLLSMGAFSARAGTRLRLATLAPKGSSFHQILLEMAEKWRAAPEGGVSLTLYTDGVMGGEADMVRRMRIGQLQAAMLTVAGLSEIDPSVDALQSMPLVFRSLDELNYVRRKMQPLLEEKFRQQGFVILFWGDAGWVRFFSNRKAVFPKDFQPLKVFAWAGDNKQVDLMKQTGYQPVPLEHTDTLTALQTGLIDAVPSTPTYALAGQFYTQAPFMLELNWVPLVGGAVVTRKAWDALPEATRAALLEAATAAGEAIQQKSRAESDAAVEAMKKRGLTAVPLSPEARAAWQSLVDPIYPRIRGSLVPADMFDRVMELLEEYRAAAAVGTP